jgi:hypothetical protein
MQLTFHEHAQNGSRDSALCALGLAPVLTMALLLAGCEIGDFDAFQAHFEHRYNLQPGARLNLENVNGSVEIEGWDQNAIEITGVKFASSQQLLDEVRIDIRHTPDSVDIRTERPSAGFWGMGARYTIHVPRMTVVDRIVTSNGPILLRDIAGQTASLRAILRTSNASIRAANVQEAVDARTSNGPVDLDNVEGQATAATSNGRITIRLDHPAATPLRATTSNGPIEITLRSEPKDNIRAETSNGSITLNLPASTGALLRADTSNAEVSTDFELRNHFQATNHPENHFHGTFGNGGSAIELSTSNGRISVLKTL